MMDFDESAIKQTVFTNINNCKESNVYISNLSQHNLYDFKEEEVKSFMFISDILTLHL